MNREDEIKKEIDKAVERPYKIDKLVDLGWMNAGGKIEQVIDIVRGACQLLGHHPMDSDHSFYGTNSDHCVICYDCGYIYHYDSSD